MKKISKEKKRNRSLKNLMSFVLFFLYKIGWIIFVEAVISSNCPSSLSFVKESINVFTPGSIR